jgi:hypothetical protein
MIKDIQQDLEDLLKNSKKILKILADYERLKANPVANVYICERKLAEISKIIDRLPDFNLKQSLVAWTSQEREEYEKVKEDFHLRFGQDLKKLLAEDDHELRGQYPLLRIGLFTLKLNFEFGEAVLYYGPEAEKITSKIPLEPIKICAEIKKYDEAIRSVECQPEKTLNDLYKAYRRTLMAAEKPFGEKLLILDVLREFVMLKQSKQFLIDPKREKFREYPRIQLSYLLYFLKKSDCLQQGLRFYVATFDATTDKRQSIWVPENEKGEGTYYSHISFDRTLNSV